VLTCGLVLFLHNLRNLQVKMSPTWHVTSRSLMKCSRGELTVIQEKFMDKWRFVLHYRWKIGWRVPTCCFLVDTNLQCKNSMAVWVCWHIRHPSTWRMADHRLKFLMTTPSEGGLLCWPWSSVTENFCSTILLGNMICTGNSGNWSGNSVTIRDCWQVGFPLTWRNVSSQLSWLATPPEGRLLCWWPGHWWLKTFVLLPYSGNMICTDGSGNWLGAAKLLVFWLEI